MVTNGNSGNVGANCDIYDPLETMFIHWSYNGGNVDNNTNGNNGFNSDNGVNGENNFIGDINTNGFIGTSGVIGTNGSIEWQMGMCLPHFTRAIAH